MPQYGHFEQVLNIFAYLKKHNNTEKLYDPSEPVIDMDQFTREDWSHSVYASGDVKLSEPLPANAPEERGAGFVMWLYVDSDHAGDCIARRSRTGFILYL